MKQFIWILVLLFFSNTSFAQNYVQDCLSNVPSIASGTVLVGTGPENGIAVSCNNDDPTCKLINVHIVFAFKSDAEPDRTELLYSCGGLMPMSYAGNSTLQPVKNNSSIDPRLACGSVIEYGKKVVTESIPIVGTEFELNYASEYNGKSSVNKILKSDFSNEGNDVFGNSIEISTGNVVVYSQGPTPLLRIFGFKYVWDGLAGLLTPSTFIDKAVFDIKVIKKVRAEELTGVSYGCFVSMVPLTFAGCRPNDPYMNFTLLDISRTLVNYKPESYGLNGWTISGHHYFDRTEKILFTGEGQRVDYSSFKTIEHPTYGTVDLLIEKNSGQLIYIFDQQGKHLETRHAVMNYSINRFSYNGDRLVGIADRMNKLTQIVFDANQKVTKIVAPYGQQTLLAVVNNQLVSVENPLNQKHEMQYDNINQLIHFKAINGVETTFTYNGSGEITQELKNAGPIQTFTDDINTWFREFTHYLSFGIAKKIQIKRFNTGQETVTLDSENRVVSRQTNYLDNYFQQKFFGSTSVFEQFSRTSMWLDDYMPVELQSTQVTESDQIVAQYVSTTENRTYSDDLNPLSINGTTLQTALNGRNITTQIDPINRKITMTDADLRVTNIFYNGRGQIGRIKPPDQVATFFTYNQDGQLVTIQKGTQSETFGYNQLGQLTSKTNSKNQTTLFAYDANANLIEKTLPNLDKIKFERSNDGEIKKIIAPNGQVHNFQLSLGDYLESYLNPDNKQTSFIYDLDKRLTKVVKPSQKEIIYNYKPQSADLGSISTPDGNITINNIDAQGRLKSITSADGIKTDIRWVANQVQKQSWFDTDGSVIGSISNIFGSNELRLESIQLNNQTIAQYQYELSGLMASITVNNSLFQYDNQFDSTSSSTYIYNNYFVYGYNKQDTLSGDKPTLVVQGQAVEDPNNQIFISMKRSFDNFGQASDYSMLTLNNQTGVLNSFYELIPKYDANDRLIEVQKIRQNYVNNQVVSTTDFYNNYSYPLGSNNNMKEFVQVPSIGSNPQRRTIASHSADDKLLTLRGSIQRDYTYTADGDLESMTNCYGRIDYEYDVFSNLKKVTLPSGKIIEYKVDGMNRRIKKLVNGVTKEYYLWYDQIHLAAILDENKNPKFTYLYGPESNSPSYLIKNGVTYRILHDPGLGSVRYIINSTTTQIVQDIEYDEYGNVMKNTNPDFQPITYAGGLYDWETGLVRFGARDYDAEMGRWLVRDPIGFKGGDSNLYAYAGNDPINRIDPSGLETESYSISVSISAGGLGFTASVSYNTDDKGNSNISYTTGAGPSMRGASATLDYQTTNAANICSLKGNGTQSGLSIYGPGGGAANYITGDGYTGFEQSVGIGTSGPGASSYQTNTEFFK